VILDSDILIDILWGHPPAVTWLAGLSSQPRVSGICAIELAFGARDAADLKTVYALLAQFPIEWPLQADISAAYLLASLRLSAGLDGPDAITAAIALRIGVPVATFNLKHFRAIPGISAVEAYSR
jgi:predicted nucleic acid-binding protein